MTYISKLREATIIRILVFFMYKIIFITFTFLILTLMNPILIKVLGFTLKLSLINLLSFIAISNLIDIAKYLVFQGKYNIIQDYEESFIWTDKILRLFLDTGNNTLFLFIGSILQYILFLIYISFFFDIPKEMYSFLMIGLNNSKAFG